MSAAVRTGNAFIDDIAADLAMATVDASTPLNRRSAVETYEESECR